MLQGKNVETMLILFLFFVPWYSNIACDFGVCMVVCFAFNGVTNMSWKEEMKDWRATAINDWAKRRCVNGLTVTSAASFPPETTVNGILLVETECSVAQCSWLKYPCTQPSSPKQCAYRVSSPSGEVPLLCAWLVVGFYLSLWKRRLINKLMVRRRAMWTCTQAVGSIFPYRAVIRQDLNSVKCLLKSLLKCVASALPLLLVFSFCYIIKLHFFIHCLRMLSFAFL